MSAHNFWHNFTHGFMHGMFGNSPFFGCWGGFSPMWGNPFMFGGFNPFAGSIFLTPTVMTGSFYPLMPDIAMPSFNMNMDLTKLFQTDNVWDNYNKQNQFIQSPVDSFEKTSLPQSKSSPGVSENEEKEDKPFVQSEKQVVNTVKNDNTAFNKMLDFVLKSEGGYVANDAGEAGNRGVRQSTYDTYRKNKGLQPRDVKELTLDETREIYYDMYYVKSGADKIKDPVLAFQVFDTAVNMGVGAAKKLLSQCGNDADKFKELRLKRYESIAANNPSKAKFLKGWKNRVSNLDDYADKNLKALA